MVAHGAALAVKRKLKLIERAERLAVADFHTFGGAPGVVTGQPNG